MAEYCSYFLQNKVFLPELSPIICNAPKHNQTRGPESSPKMASKFVFLPLLWAVAVNIFTLSAVALEAGNEPPVIYIINAVDGANLPPISLGIKAGGNLKVSADLSRGQHIQVRADANLVYFASVFYGLRFTSFHAYEPARDKGRAAIYWRGDSSGFAISYDEANFKMVAPWESEAA
ncbi:hypothetical protein OROGR_014197 [Orobanche gracilis]